jgi:hypothetical protein
MLRQQVSVAARMSPDADRKLVIALAVAGSHAERHAALNAHGGTVRGKPEPKRRRAAGTRQEGLVRGQRQVESDGRFEVQDRLTFHAISFERRPGWRKDRPGQPHPDRYSAAILATSMSVE